MFFFQISSTNSIVIMYKALLESHSYLLKLFWILSCCLSISLASVSSEQVLLGSLRELARKHCKLVRTILYSEVSAFWNTRLGEMLRQLAYLHTMRIVTRTFLASLLLMLSYFFRHAKNGWNSGKSRSEVSLGGGCFQFGVSLGWGKFCYEDVSGSSWILLYVL